jgi:glycosyltransferase involved in cell wall biosynthesis
LIKILIDARVSDDLAGGVKKAIQGTAQCFKFANFNDLEFTFLLDSPSNDWLLSYAPVKSKYILLESKSNFRKGASKILRQIRKIEFGDRFLSRLRAKGLMEYRIPACPQVVDYLNFDLVHFPTQFGFETRIPSLYQPHDFQHKEFPEFFQSETLLLREIGMRTMMEQSTLIALGTQWTINDLVKHYPEFAFKTINLPVFPRLLPTISDADLNVEKPQYEYILYPAMNWPHKNHIRLLEAFQIVVRQYPELKLVLTGGDFRGDKNFSRKIEELDLQNSVSMTGYLSESELASMYENAKVVVVPSLFESESLPIWEAFRFGIPVAASNVTALPAQVGNAAILFNPFEVREIAESIIRIISTKSLQLELSNNGLERYLQLTPINTAIAYRFAYRRILKLKFDETDVFWQSKGFTF